jgi:hypothetical protein
MNHLSPENYRNVNESSLVSLVSHTIHDDITRNTLYVISSCLAVVLPLLYNMHIYMHDDLF